MGTHYEDGLVIARRLAIMRDMVAEGEFGADWLAKCEGFIRGVEFALDMLGVDNGFDPASGEQVVGRCVAHCESIPSREPI